MPVIDKKYEELTLKDNHLSDPLLMALAWKKSHQYIRTTNWYADNFELDASALNLVRYCEEWVKALENKVQFTELELVPAPKASHWEFVKPKALADLEVDELLSIDLAEDYSVIWKPKPNPKEKKALTSPLKLRPLAHMPIREQSLMTLLVMGLANKVETIQGNPETSLDEVHEKNVVSYGNRLYCQYNEDDEANYSYGATTIYSKFFVDYRKFLDRPYHFATQQLGEVSPDERVYIVELDLAKFFDFIKREVLINKINKLVERNAKTENYERLEILLKAFKEWTWSSDSIDKYAEICASKDVPNAPEGLPQGLVAAGFLSNVYMLDFDEQLSDLVGTEFSSNELRLVDYCRYVDDLRLVVVGPKSFDGKVRIEVIRDEVIKLVNSLPCYKKLNLKINEEKTKVDVFHGRKVGVSKNLAEIQSRLSGPISLDEAENQLGQLESLLSLSSDIDIETDTETNDRPVNLLANIESTRFDVREDTLKRFSANKLVKVLKEMRHFSTQVPDENGVLKPGDWDYIQERIARRFIACWSHDPSLVLLLKKGLELFPSTKLLDPVLQQLEAILLRLNEPKQIAVAEYCLSEIYRHAATVIHKKDLLALPAHTDVDSFFERLQASAAKHCEQATANNFSLLAEQAHFLLLAREDTILEREFGDSKLSIITKLTLGFRSITLPDEIDAESIAVNILMANQICSDNKEAIRASSCLLENIKIASLRFNTLKLLLNQECGFVISLVRHARAVKQTWCNDKNIKELISALHLETKPLTKPLVQINNKVSLLRLMLRDDNPFSNEIMVLKLLQAALKNIDEWRKNSDKRIDLANTKVKFDHFSSVVKYETFNAPIEIFFKFETNKLPNGWEDFCSSVNDDISILRTIGEFIRGVIVGNQDWTSFGQSLPTKNGYQGVRTSYYKRQLGLMTSPEAIAGVGAQISGWLTGLLSKLLKWPGISVNNHGYEWPLNWSVDKVEKLVSDRLHELENAYCKMSGIPSLLEKQSLPWSADKETLSVVMVQSRLPRKSDFGAFGLMLDNPIYRAKHRRHIASVAELVLKHIDVQRVDDPIDSKDKSNVDLIIWPELAVHNDDLDVLVALSRKTKAMIFAGMGFIQQDGIKGPNNCAVWIVPTQHQSSQREIIRLQGKQNMMAAERKSNVQPWRPYQLLLELVHPAYKSEKGFVLTGSICFDATDISLSADLRDKSNAYLVCALNQDVTTFDSMVEALHYHMYQHVVLVNTGEFGGSFAKAPYKDAHKRLIAHVHGNDQVSINTFEMNMFDFRRDGLGQSMQSDLERKAAPAGI